MNNLKKLEIIKNLEKNKNYQQILNIHLKLEKLENKYVKSLINNFIFSFLYIFICFNFYSNPISDFAFLISPLFIAIIPFLIICFMSDGYSISYFLNLLKGYNKINQYIDLNKEYNHKEIKEIILDVDNVNKEYKHYHFINNNFNKNLEITKFSMLQEYIKKIDESDIFEEENEIINIINNISDNHYKISLIKLLKKRKKYFVKKFNEKSQEKSNFNKELKKIKSLVKNDVKLKNKKEIKKFEIKSL